MLARLIDYVVFIFIEAVKAVSKKEQKRLENAEFERLMAEMGSQDAPKAAEESKQSATAEGNSEIDEKKRLANKKKNDKKKKAKQAAAATTTEEVKAEEMTEE